MKSGTKVQHASRFRFPTSATLLAACAVGSAQSFNIDIDINSGGPEVGTGVPSSSFGAAANQPGFWNRRSASIGSQAQVLRTLDGALSQVTLNANGSGGGQGSGWTGNSGDFRLLMNDSTYLSVPIVYRFENLEVGHYKVWTYSADAGDRSRPTIITVAEAETPVGYSGLSPMNENVFQERVSHSLHSLYVSGSSLSVRVENMLSYIDGSVNGLQVQRLSVPEPSAILAFFGAGLLIRIRGTKSCRRRDIAATSREQE